MAVAVIEGSPIRYNTGAFGTTILYSHLKNASIIIIECEVISNTVLVNTVVYSIDTILGEDKYMPILWQVYVYIMEASIYFTECLLPHFWQ